jgi:hypothetical protein
LQLAAVWSYAACLPGLPTTSLLCLDLKKFCLRDNLLLFLLRFNTIFFSCFMSSWYCNANCVGFYFFLMTYVGMAGRLGCTGQLQGIQLPRK